MLDEQDAGLHVSTDGHAPTVEAWLTHWLDTIAATKVRPSTLHTYRGYVANRIVPNIGKHRLDRLRPEHLERLYAELLEAGLALGTAKAARTATSRSAPARWDGSPTTPTPSAPSWP